MCIALAAVADGCRLSSYRFWLICPSNYIVNDSCWRDLRGVGDGSYGLDELLRALDGAAEKWIEYGMS
jgi:hypothetical protein